MAAQNNFVKEIEELKDIYNELDDDNKGKLEEAVSMVLTKFKERL